MLDAKTPIRYDSVTHSRLVSLRIGTAAASMTQHTPSLKRQSVGRRGEDYAARYLAAHGCVIRARNWRCPTGELDLIAEQGETLIFVEVRTRRGDRLGTPEESITPAKRARLIATAQAYVSEHAVVERAWRIDVIAIELGQQGEVRRCNWIENAVEET